MENNNNAYNNVESMIETFRGQVKNVVSMRKFDGITIECDVDTEAKRENAMNEMQALSKKLNFIPVAIEARADSATLFGVQYPELKPKYLEEQVKKMYTDTFEFLIDNIKMKDPKSITKTILVENMDRLTKHAITVYCRSNINQYKDNVNNYLNNTKYRAKINSWYLEFIENYLRKVM